MGKRKRLEPWEETFCKAVNLLGVGWSVREDYGKIVIRHRPTNQRAPVGFKWNEKDWPDALARIRNIYSLFNQGDNLKEAAKNLYKTLRLIKKNGYRKIAVERIPNIKIGEAINDRLFRASKK